MPLYMQLEGSFYGKAEPDSVHVWYSSSLPGQRVVRSLHGKSGRLRNWNWAKHYTLLCPYPDLGCRINCRMEMKDSFFFKKFLVCLFALTTLVFTLTLLNLRVRTSRASKLKPLWCPTTAVLTPRETEHTPHTVRWSEEFQPWLLSSL